MATLQELESITPRPATPAPARTSLRVDLENIRRQALALLRAGLGEYPRRLNSRLLATLDEEFLRWLTSMQDGIQTQLKSIPKRAREKWLEERLYQNDRRRPENQSVRLLIDFLFQYSQRQISSLKRLKIQNVAFRKTIASVRTDRERCQAILQYAEQLGASPKQLRGDEKAFARWFDEEAVNDRFEKRLGQLELLLAFVFDRLGEMLETIIQLVHEVHAEQRDRHDDQTETPITERFSGLWRRLSIESRLHEALRYDGDPRIYAAVLRCLRRAVQAMPEGLAEDLLNERTLLTLHQVAAEGKADVWVQCEAMSIVYSLSQSHATPLLQRRIDQPVGTDDLFVRRHIFKILEAQLLRGVEIDIKLPSPGEEPSEFVRQKIAKVAFLADDHAAQQLYRDLAFADEVPQVRAAALLAGIEVECSLSKTVEYLEVVAESLANEQDPFVLRVACHAVIALLQRLDSTSSPTDPQEAEPAELAQKRATVHAFYQQRIFPVIRRLQCHHQHTKVRRWMAQTNAQAWAWMDPQSAELIRWLRPILPTIKPGTTRRLPKQPFQQVSDEKLGRILAVLSQTDFGFDMHRGWLHVHLTRGPSFGFRLWRLIHELRNPATDKRQALSHVVGRINTALIRAPSQILGELSETKIPGEPLTIDEEGSWRPYLPLLDDFISVLNLSWLRARTTTLYTSQGITEITAPKGVGKRIIAAYWLNFRFQRLADKRNWDNDTFPASTYIESMRQLGFDIRFREYEQTADDLPSGQPATCQTDDTAAADGESGEAETSQQDATVRRFFTTACAVPGLLLGSFVESFQEQFLRYADYFGSSFENSIEQLLIFASLILFLILAKHFYSNFTFRRARRKIPISIGGWGTRGKSGTERLKAALIGAMGHGLVSKTTGCEAMFIQGEPFGEPLEIPLFRPYDKATIWEQRNLILMASKLEPSVFLWECMALTPSYVDVLQRQWTCDDLATITNTYPDHEDLQGPAGHNVATTISGFVPVNSHLITSEEVMRPYVMESCRAVDTTCRGVGWLESGLVTEDVLERFPYKEHPDNVALVAAMADELGVNYEVALKAMGDYLVPDLGVLKTHPAAEVRTRKIQFTNGMSANERFGCMGNWKRLGFDQQDPWEDPTTWVCGVVNNRADRVPRSKVFAKIIVEDMNADRFFLIGNNLKGLLGFIHDAWDEQAQTLSLCASGQPWDNEYAITAFQQAAWEFRQPTRTEHVQQKLRCMIEAVTNDSNNTPSVDIDTLIANWNDPDAVQAALTKTGVRTNMVQSIFRHQSELITALGEFQDMLQMIQSATPKETERIESRYIQLLETWYFRKLVTVENYDATGEEVVGCIVDETPPGFFARTIGLQNIKGTGLDFVYRFQAWDVCHDACQAAHSDDPNVALRGLQALVGMPAIGQLAVNRVREVIRHGRTSPTMRRSDLQALLGQLESNLGNQVDDVPAANASEPDTEPVSAGEESPPADSIAEWNKWLLDTSEEFLDVNDSLRRRDTADAIYRDLTTGRISRQRAVAELRKINKRQKGGWLTSWIARK
jgi:poly-gamma-glutamate synthase PgsB/CapB